MSAPMPQRPVIKIPTDDEIGHAISVGVNPSLEARIAVVRGWLRQVRDADRAFEAMETAYGRLQDRYDGQVVELKALREKVGSLPPTERAAAEQRYEMLGQIRKARNKVEAFESRITDLVRELKEDLRA